MKKILILTVGGSPVPIVNSIDDYKPDFVFFICSTGKHGSDILIDGPGNPCGDKRMATCPECNKKFYLGNSKGKSIASQCGLNESDYAKVILDDPDDLSECYNALVRIDRRIDDGSGQKEVTANFTGGTKTMSVALAYYALVKPQWRLAINMGPRQDLVKVRGGDIFTIIDKSIVIVDYQLDKIRNVLKKRDYAQAEEIIKTVLQEPLSGKSKNKVLKLWRMIHVFHLWDQLRHDDALELIESLDGMPGDYIVFLKKVAGKIRGHPYAIVADLISNARRRALQGRYDDAIARMYRAVEMFAHVSLSDRLTLEGRPLSVNDLPEGTVRETYQIFARNDGTLFLGLQQSYRLLADLGEPAGIGFLEHEGALLNALKKRNQSILAHGITPLGQKDFRQVEKTFINFLEDCSKEADIDLETKQFPGEELLSYA